MQAFIWSLKPCTPLLRITRLDIKPNLHVKQSPHVSVKVWSKQFATDRAYLQPEQLSLLPGQVDVWWLRSEEVQDVNLTNQYIQLLTPAEQQYVAQASSGQTAKERLLARTLQRTVLARYCSDCIAPPALQFERNRHGKPRLSWEESQDQPEPPIHFSLTHTHSLLAGKSVFFSADAFSAASAFFFACAIFHSFVEDSTGKEGSRCSRESISREENALKKWLVTMCDPVGLDVEAADRHTRTDVLKLAKRRFAPIELASLEDICDSNDRAKRFVQMWTLKEAYVKALGQGISVAPGLKGFSVVLEKRSNVQTSTDHKAAPPSLNTAYQIHFAADHHSCKFQPDFVLLNPFDEHIAALCMQQQSARAESFGRQQSTDSNVSGSTVFDSSKIGDCMDHGLAHGSDNAMDSSYNLLPSVRCIQTVPLVYEQCCTCNFVACSDV